MPNFEYFSGHRLIPQHSEITHLANYLKRCSSLKELESLYAFMTKSNSTRDCFLMNQFITACSKFHHVEWAIAAFTQMRNPNIFVYNALIGALLRCSQPDQALQIYSDMLRTEINPSSYTFPSIIKSCTLVPAVKLGESIHGQVWKYGFGLHIHVQTALMDFYSNFGRVLDSRLVFDNMPERDSFAWTTMVAAHVRFRDLNSARKLFDKMPEKNTASWNAMIHGFARMGDVESAKELFNKMPEKDLISWTTMIHCYSQNKYYEEALDIFREMKDHGISPDEVTMSTIISACAHLGLLDEGKDIHLYVIQSQFDLDVYIGSALIDMYAKCGALQRSLMVFFKLQEKNLFCWNSVIEGLAAHGYAKEALAMFRMMEKEKVTPNGVTFVSILTSCTHAGLIEEGRSIFQKMTGDFSIPPEIEHYGCIVDLLCKAGLLEEALDIIRNMRMEPNSFIWGALLSGCKIHKNLEIAQKAVEKLMVLEPNSTGYYALLINMCAEEHRWGDVARIRANMKKRGVEKRSPGSSWIEVEKKMVQFAACDNYHPASEQIYLLLDGLVGQLKLTGYAAEVEFVL
ncbi:hypothetical protein M9H77_33038 [Catharanthus roseus]|uniref:Uncharacterized protein n=1 Tax=Catharanthus roseus TaxID=4058 RepID=A0ACC0A5I0_CATRO|nr:hypothetical protein M9H77_33038 [Catharanthus roseus]